MTPPLISLRDVHVRLGGKEILRGVTTSLPSRRISALIGLNGSGKTTLLRTLLGEVPFKGDVRFHCGHDHSRPAPEHIGYVPQKLRMEANIPLTVRDLFALALQRAPIFFGIQRRWNEQMGQMLDQVRANPSILDQPMDKLSGGEQQRVLLALALHPNPELLLLDEPAAGIDFRDQEKFYDLIANLNLERQVTILLVSHDLNLVSRHAQHVLCLHRGVIECEGTPADVVHTERMLRTFGEPTALPSTALKASNRA